MIDEQRQRMLPELMRFACDPQLDAMTRSWIFDALRDISGQKLVDDPAEWRAWYAEHTGNLPCISDSQALMVGALLQP
ncbi:MAG TPA: hypothetical protein VGR50_05325 [Terriglobales bacterium]|nr:hypothetical protein [Terriglobales bacterium]